jgi:hypothetical protein
MLVTPLLNHLEKHRRKWFFGFIGSAVCAFTVLCIAVISILSQPSAPSKPVALFLTALLAWAMVSFAGSFAVPTLLVFAPPAPSPIWRKAIFYFQLTIIILWMLASFIPIIMVLTGMP